MAKQKRGRRIIEGRVLKANNAKTRIVVIDQRLRHELYGRVMRRTAKCVAHDENEESRVGDIVRIEECRPMSRTKRWRVVGIAKHGLDLQAPSADAERPIEEVVAEQS